MGHRSTRCESKRCCRRCHGRHHQSICEVSKTTEHAPLSTKDNKPKPPSNDGKPPATNETSNTKAVTLSTKKTTPPENLVTKNPCATENSANQTTATSTKSRNKVLLQTAVIYLCARRQRFVLATDSGTFRQPQSTYLQNHFVEEATRSGSYIFEQKL